MNKELKNNLKKVFTKLNTGEIEFILLNGMGIYENYITSEPFIISENGKEICNSKNYFSFYIIPNLIKSILKAINFHSSGSLCLENNLYAPSILNYYSSAFISLKGFLGVHGLIFSNVTFDNSTSVNELKLLKYGTNSDSWIIEKCSTNHFSKWEKLKSIFKTRNQAPEIFLNFFEYFFHASVQNNAMKDPLFSKFYKNPTIIKYEDKLDDLLKLIADTRHNCTYNSFGSTPVVFSETKNGNYYSKEAFGYQTVLYNQLSEYFIEFNFESLKTLINECNLNSVSKIAIKSAVSSDWFDNVEFDKIQNEQMKKNITLLNEWLNNNNILVL